MPFVRSPSDLSVEPLYFKHTKSTYAIFFLNDVPLLQRLNHKVCSAISIRLLWLDVCIGVVKNLDEGGSTKDRKLYSTNATEIYK